MRELSLSSRGRPSRSPTCRHHLQPKEAPFADALKDTLKKQLPGAADSRLQQLEEDKRILEEIARDLLY
jgi:hypothetical protein